MKRTHVAIYTLIVLLFLSDLSKAQVARTKEKTGTYTSEINFRREEVSVSGDYKNNDSTLTDLLQFIRSLRSDTIGMQLADMEITGTASPEGDNNINTRLSLARARELERILLRECDKDVPRRLSSYVHSWQKVFMLLDSIGYQHTNEIKAIVDSATATESDDASRSARIIAGLKLLHGGEVWQFLDEELLPALRTTIVTIIYRMRSEEPHSVNDDMPTTAKADIEYHEPEFATLSAVGIKRRRELITHLGVSTNLLYDVALVPNIGLEFDLGRHFTLGANWMYGWWKTDKRHYYWRIYGGDVNLQMWAGHHGRLFAGHHFGVYGQIVTYDFELGHRGYLADKWSYGGGLVYGYSWPVKRRLRIDASIFLGYQTGELKEYLPIDTHYVWQLTKQRHYYGPTQAQLSLVWLLDKMPCWRQSRKGGAR